MNLTNVNLKDGNYDEALRGIGEALRIAQNNADEESINYCLIYLYNIAGVLGLYKDVYSKVLSIILGNYAH